MNLDVKGIEHNQFSPEISRYSMPLFEKSMKWLQTQPKRLYVVEGNMKKFKYIKPDFALSLLNCLINTKQVLGIDGFEDFYISVLRSGCSFIKNKNVLQYVLQLKY